MRITPQDGTNSPKFGLLAHRPSLFILFCEVFVEVCHPEAVLCRNNVKELLSNDGTFYDDAFYFLIDEGGQHGGDRRQLR